MFKKILAFILLGFIVAKASYAFKPETFVSVVHLVGDSELVTLQNAKLTYQQSTPSAIFNDWLLSTEVLDNATAASYFKELISKDDSQSLGLFLVPKKQPLDKMSVEERKIEIDTQFDKFFTTFGIYPKFISAHIMDTQSLNYLQKKYGLLNFVFLPGQHKEIPSNVGGYEYAPYIASNKNFFLPSSSTKNRNSVVVVEANYLLKDTFKQKIEFVSQKKFNEFTHVAFWTNLAEQTPENLKSQKEIFSTLKSISDKHSLNQKSLGSFSDWYLNRYPESTPAFYFTDGLNHTYQSPWYKAQFSQKEKVLGLQKITLFEENFYDPSFTVPNPGESGVQALPQIDLQNQANTSLKEDLYFSYLRNFDYWKMSLKNNTEEFILEPDKIKFKNIDPKVESNHHITVTQKGKQTTITFNYLKKNYFVYFSLFIILGLFLYYLLKKKPPKHLLFGIFLSLLANLVNVRSGSFFPFGLGFWGPHGHDALFHLSIIEKFAKDPLSLSHPQISGEVITNYHLFFDYLAGLVVRFTGLSSLDVYFRFFPLFAGIALVFLLDKVLTKLNLNSLQKTCTYIFVFFAGSFGFLVRLVQNHDYLTGESAFWANQSLSMFLNPPYLLSIIFLLFFILLFSKKQKNYFDYLILVLIGGLLAQVKVYGFILLCIALFLNRNFFLSVSVGFLGLIINLPLSEIGSSPFVFNPLWFPRAMFESADRVYFESIATAWQVFEISGQFTKVFLLSSFALTVFLLGNLGVRVLGLLYFVKNKPIDEVDSLIRILIMVSLVLPLLVTQSVNPWNSIQFLYYGLFLLSFYTTKSLPKNPVVSILIIILGTFGSVGTLRDYLTVNSSSRVSHQELLGLKTLKEQPLGLVLSPVHSQRSVLSAPVPLYDYISTAYISALTGQPEFLSDTINLDITGVSYQEKHKNVQRFYNTTDTTWAIDFLKKERIAYVIDTPLKRLKLTPASLGLETLHLSGEVSIYKVAVK